MLFEDRISLILKLIETQGSIENFSDFIHQIFFKKHSDYCQFNEKYVTLSKN